jgi:hypothetical protein
VGYYLYEPEEMMNTKEIAGFTHIPIYQQLARVVFTKGQV